MPDIAATVQTILQRQKLVPSQRSLLVAVTGIYAADKGFLTAQIVAELRKHRLAIFQDAPQPLDRIVFAVVGRVITHVETQYDENASLVSGG